MKKLTFLTAVAAVAIMTLAASCGQNAQKQTASDISDEQLSQWTKEIFYALPSSATPGFLQTEKQRKDRVATIESYGNTITNNIADYDDNDGGSHQEWYMGVYVTTDQQNAVVVIQCTAGVDEASGLVFEKTLNYNFQTKQFTEIELPIEPFTTDEALQRYTIKDLKMNKLAKEYYNKTKELYYKFDKNGFSAIANLIMFWYDGTSEIFDYYNNNDVMSDDLAPAYRQWNGKKFVKQN